MLVDGILQIAFAGPHGDVRGYIKLERTEPRLLIFDVQPWQRIEDIAAAREASATRVEQVAVAQRVPL